MRLHPNQWKKGSIYSDDDEASAKVGREKAYLTPLRKSLDTHLSGITTLISTEKYACKIHCTKEGTNRKAVVSFKYERNYGRDNVEGLCLEIDGSFNGSLHKINRNYKFDFETLTTKPATIKKIAVAIQTRLDKLVEINEAVAKHQNSAKAMAAEGMKLLQEANYQVTLEDNPYVDRYSLVITREDGTKVISLQANPQDFSSKSRLYSGLSITATLSNLVEVVRCIDALRRAMDKE